MEESYVLALKLVSSRYDRSYEYFNILTLALSTLLYKYKDKRYLVEDIFKDVDIYIEKDSIEDILKSKNIEIVSSVEGNEEVSCGISTLGYTYTFEDNKFVKHKDNSFIICSYNADIIDLLNTFIHEYNHLVKSCLNETKINELEYTIRSGIGYYRCRYNPKSDILYEEHYYETFDEVINVIETTEMMENSGLLPIDDLGIDRNNLSEDISYELCVSLIRPLWSNPTFKSLIEDNIIDGEIDTIVKSFNDVLGEYAFEKLAEYLDDLQYMEDNTTYNKKKYYRIKNNIKKMVSEYNRRTNYTYVFSK